MAVVSYRRFWNSPGVNPYRLSLKLLRFPAQAPHSLIL